MAEKKSEWLDITEDGEPVIDWEQAVQNSFAFDGGVSGILCVRRRDNSM